MKKAIILFLLACLAAGLFSTAAFAQSDGEPVVIIKLNSLKTSSEV